MHLMAYAILAWAISFGVSEKYVISMLSKIPKAFGVTILKTDLEHLVSASPALEENMPKQPGNFR